MQGGLQGGCREAHSGERRSAIPRPPYRSPPTRLSRMQPGKVPFSPQQIAERALSLASVMPNNYSLLHFNCEHFAVYCCTGVRLSRQVADAGRATMGIGLLSLAVPVFAPFALGSMVTGGRAPPASSCFKVLLHSGCPL